MKRPLRGLALLVPVLSTLLGGSAVGAAQTARITEETRSIPTYPFDEPNPVPILTRDARLYPYHSFEGYAATAEPRDWTVVRLENDWVEVFVLPEVGGKVWGAVVKETGHEFIYRNEVMKFRNIALRGPWTSGGIEFNFGVIGHTPATATPVDYRLVENPDGSVSCWIGGMDLPSRTHWRVEIRLPADKAAFETHVFWYNPTPLDQPFYNWMTSAAFARDDLEMSIPGNAFLEHSGQERSWPVDGAGRYLPVYRNNTFDGHKSYHVVGELNDFFGGYYHDDDWGFGHWARHEEMPGQKLWLWALSREGGIWEDLLTDTDGQYVEYQAGPLLVQYAPDEAVNPITQATFGPGSSSRWSETWFPLEGVGGLSDASSDGALSATRDGAVVSIGVNAFRAVSDTLEVWSGGSRLSAEPVSLQPLQPHRVQVGIDPATPFRVRMRALDLDYESDPSGRLLSRPFTTDPDAVASIPEVDRTVFEALELMKGRWYGRARPLIESVLAEAPWNREALLAAGELEYRRGLYDSGLEHVTRALQLDTYDPRANFLAGALHRALGRTADARDAFGWAARSMEFRSAANVQLAEIMLGENRPREAARYARLALDYDRYSMSAWRALAVSERLVGGTGVAPDRLAPPLADDDAVSRMVELDPLAHMALAETYLATGSPDAAEQFVRSLGGEYPDQTLLELAIWYAGVARPGDALALLSAWRAAHPSESDRHAVITAWQAWLSNDPTLLSAPTAPAFQFPYRPETLAALTWADEQSDDWVWTYLRALDLWAVDRAAEAASMMSSLGDTPDFAAAYVARARLGAESSGTDAVPDLQRAVTLAPDTRLLHVELVRTLQEAERWPDALTATATARERFPDDFNLALLDVRSLIQTGRALEAISILDDIGQVLPSESGRESHRLWEWAHTAAALDALDIGDDGRAREHLLRAMEWPAHLGQGRPYAPEERLARYLLSVAEQRLGDAEAARVGFEEVVAASVGLGGGANPGVPGASDAAYTRLDLLGIRALQALGRTVDPTPLDSAPVALFDDPEGRLLRRALLLDTAR